MPNLLAKYLLAVTAVSPAFGAAAILAVAKYESWAWAASFASAGILSAAITLLVIGHIGRTVAREPLAVKEIELADQKVLEFLLAYLLPIYGSNNLTSPAGSMILVLYSLLVVSVVAVQGNVFQFNPVLTLAGYHFYVAATADKTKYLVISRRAFHAGERTLLVRPISSYIYLEG